MNQVVGCINMESLINGLIFNLIWKNQVGKERAKFCCIEPYFTFIIPLAQSSTKGTNLIWVARKSLLTMFFKVFLAAVFSALFATWVVSWLSHKATRLQALTFFMICKKEIPMFFISSVWVQKNNKILYFKQPLMKSCCSQVHYIRNWCKPYLFKWWFCECISSGRGRPWYISSLKITQKCLLHN